MSALVQYQVSDMERMAKAFAASKLFGITNVDQALALCLVAQAEGRHPATAAQDYNIIQGRPAKKADAMLRDFIAGGGKVEWHKLDDTKADATFSHPGGGSARIDWDMKRAQSAQLGGKDMWKKFPRQMLRSRVISEGVRTVYPMATSGMYEPGEVADFAPDPAPQSSVVAVVEDMRDITPAVYGPDDVYPPPSKIASNGIKRLSSAKANEKGLGQSINQAIWSCQTRTELAMWHADFEKHTAEVPLSWLDSIQNDVILRGEEIDREQTRIARNEIRQDARGNPIEEEAAFRHGDQDGLAGGDDGFPGDKEAA